jgi:hypothetical protein
MPDVPEISSRPRRSSAVLLALIAAVLLTAGGLYVMKRSATSKDPPRGTGALLPSPEVAGQIARIRARPHVVFLEPQASGRPRIAFAPLDDLEHARVVTELEAERIYVAGRRFVGLGTMPDAQGETKPGAFVLDEELHCIRTIPLTGIPSRVRASRDGALAAVTLFVTGDSYAGAGFSTRTYVFDLDGKLPVRDLERMKVMQGEDEINPLQMNFWGVAFDEPPTHFYVTLRVGEVRRLVDASLETNTGRVIHPKVECPSLSPDRKRIAYKRLAGILPLKWNVAILDLASDRERVLAGEARSIDDQVEWLDERHVLYAVTEPDAGGAAATNLWSLDVDAVEPARLFLRNAQSPCVARP